MTISGIVVLSIYLCKRKRQQQQRSSIWRGRNRTATSNQRSQPTIIDISGPILANIPLPEGLYEPITLSGLSQEQQEIEALPEPPPLPTFHPPPEILETRL